MKKTGNVISLIILLVVPVFLSAQTGLSGAYIARFTTQERPDDSGDSEQNMRLYNRVLLQYAPSKNFAVKTALRRADYFQENMGNTHIYYGYVDWSPTSVLGLKVGRQYPYNKMIRRAIDGASAEWALSPQWTVEGLWGLYAPYDRAGITDTPEDEHGSYLALQYSGADHASLRASGYQQVSGGQIHNYFGVDGRYPDLIGFSLYGFFKYNVTENFTQEAELQARRELGEQFAVSAAYKYRDPDYDIPEWYWQFTVDPYSTVRMGLDYFLTRTGSLSFEYFTRMLNDRNIERYRFGWLASNWTAGVVYSLNNNGNSEEINVYGSVKHHFGKSLLVGAGADYFDYVFNESYEEPLNAFGSNIFAKYRIGEAITAGAKVYYLTNPEFSDDVRFLGELSYQF